MNALDAFLKTGAARIRNLATNEAMLTGLVIERVTIRLQAEPMRHTLEDGTTEIDTKVVRPTVLFVEAICPNPAALSALSDLEKDRASLMEIRTRGLIFRNLKVGAVTYDQSKAMLSATPARIEFRQLLVENYSPIVFAIASDSSMIDRGIAAVKEVVANARTFAGDTVDTATELADKIMAGFS